MKRIDWQDTPAPDHVQQARMYEVLYYTNDDSVGVTTFFDAATGVFYLREGRRWLSSIQTFPFGEVKNQ